jgi:hypothetical protein
LGLGLLFSLSCTTSAPTELIVVVSSDYAPVTQLARIVITTSDETGGVISTQDLTVVTNAGEAGVTLPFSFGVRPAGDASRPVRLSVEGFAPGGTDAFVTRRATAPFVQRERRRLVMLLERACAGVVCVEAETCVGGTCVDRTVPISALDPVEPGHELDVDAGTPSPPGDAGPSCTADPACDEAIHVEVGRGFACALRASGRVACWGEAAALGQLGNGARVASAMPVGVLGVTDGTAIVAGDDFTCVGSEATVSCWGSNAVGQLARDGGESDAMAGPVEGLPGPQLFAAAATACGSGGGGAPSCWGGALSTASTPLPDVCGATACARRPVEQPALSSLLWLADEGHLCAALGEHAACAGANTFGEVGDGTREPRTEPTPIEGLALVWAVSTTTRGACAVDAVLDPETEETISTLHCWGADDLGQVGDDGAATDRCVGDAPCALRPVTIPSVVQPIEIAGTGDTTCARELSGRVLCWGSDENGALGDGVGAPGLCGETPCARTPSPIGGLTDAVDLDARAGTFCAVRRGGAIVCWGAGYAALPTDVGPLPR